MAGVLAALAAQAWWEGRQERARERDYLRQLLVDTRENERRLGDAIGIDSVSGVSVARAMTALLASGPLPPPDSLGEWVRGSGSSSDPRLVTGTYQALMGTGDLRLVRNDSLRARLATYAAELGSETERQRQLRGAMQDAVPAMARALPFMRGVFLGDAHPGATDVARFRTDPEVGGVLLTLQAASVNRLSGLRHLREETRALLRALEADPTLRDTP